MLAKALILWEQRVEATAGPIVDLRRKSLRTSIPDHLYHRFPSDFSSIPRTDIDASSEQFFADGNHRLVDWYRALITPIAEGIQWRDGQPFLELGHVGAWEGLCSSFDPDALLTLDLVLKYGGGSPSEMVNRWPNWRTIPRAGDRELVALWARGLSDLHVHVGGVRIPQLVWLEILSEETSIAAFGALTKIYESAGRDIRKDRNEAQTSWRALAARAGESAAMLPSSRGGGGGWWRWSHELLRPQRRAFIVAWSAMLEVGKREDEISKNLDIYLSHKHRFLQLVRQRSFSSEPGLRQFAVRYFQALRPAPARGKWKSANFSYGASPRLEMMAFGDASQYLLESKDLRRIELRIVPFYTATEYLSFFSKWERLACSLRQEHSDCPEIRFAVHFNRTRGNKQRGRDQSDAVRRLLDLDRQTAALRLALDGSGTRERRWMSALARVDVAGQERDTPAALFGLHLRLLREDPDALAFLESLGLDCPRWLQFWARLRERRAHRAPPGSPRLGMTIHAGEDFADVLDGLYQIASAIDICGLTAGNGLGHALALATSVDLFRKDTWRYTAMPTGTEHDSLCWIYQFVLQHGTPELRSRYLDVLQSMIASTARHVFQESIPRFQAATADDYVWVWRNSVAPSAARDGPTALRKALLAECSSGKVMVAREQMRLIDHRRRELSALIEWAQAELHEQVCKKGIVVEMNPGSNLRISGASSLAASPTVKLFQAVANGLLACVNTDDPGIFTSCIENEYALLLEGSIDGENEGEMRRLLEVTRRIGREAVYWP